MKKLAAIILALTLILCVMAAPASAADKKVKIGWTMAYFDHPVYQLLMKGAQEIADSLDDCELIFADGKNDPNIQASQIDAFIAQGVDGIILTAAVSDPMLPSIKKSILHYNTAWQFFATMKNTNF